MDLEIIILSKVSQRKTSIIWYHVYVESKKMMQMSLFTKQKYIHIHRKQLYGYQRENTMERDGLGVWDGICTLSYVEWMVNEDLPCSTGNSTQYSMITDRKRIWKRMDKCICITESLCCTAEINTTFIKSTIIQ